MSIEKRALGDTAPLAPHRTVSAVSLPIMEGMDVSLVLDTLLIGVNYCDAEFASFLTRVLTTSACQCPAEVLLTGCCPNPCQYSNVRWMGVN
jgi:hypothetical protein